MKPIKPMLAEITTEPELKILTESKKYIFEPKLDGIRMIAEVKDHKVRLYARSGTEKTHLFPDLDIQTTTDCVLDGEVVSGNGFNGIQHRANRIEGIAQAVKDHPARYSVFDILQFQDLSLMSHGLMDRKSILTNVLCPTENVSATKWVDDGVALFDLMKQNSLEGVVGKEKIGLYHENKREWKKVKCWQEGTFVAVGYTPGTGWRASTFGALVLADTNGNYVGEVGTGFTEGDIRKLFATFKMNPVSPNPGGKVWKMAPKQTTYIMSFPVKVKYLEFSNEGILRFPVFKGVV